MAKQQGNEMATWHEANEVPPVAVGNMHEYVLAVLRNRTGKVYSFAATYLEDKIVTVDGSQGMVVKGPPAACGLAGPKPNDH